MVVIVRHIQAGMPVIVKRAEGHAIMVDLHAVPLRCLPAAYAVFYNFKKIHCSSISAQKNGGLPIEGQAAVCVLSYAVFASSSFLASRKAFFRAPCRLICAAYRQSSLQYFTSDLVVVNTLAAVFRRYTPGCGPLPPPDGRISHGSWGRRTGCSSVWMQILTAALTGQREGLTDSVFSSLDFLIPLPAFDAVPLELFLPLDFSLSQLRRGKLKLPDKAKVNFYLLHPVAVDLFPGRGR